MTTQLIQRDTIESLVQQRDEALSNFFQSIDLIVSARLLIEPVCRHGVTDAVGSFYSADTERERVRKNLDRGMWRHVLDLLNIKSLMTAKQGTAIEKQLEDDPMIFNVENVQSTITYLASKSGNIFEQSVIDLYETRNFTYKTNEPNRFGQKLILDYAYKPNSNSVNFRKRDVIYDLDKVVHLINGQAPPEYYQEGLLATLNTKTMSNQYAFELETAHFKVKKYKKGTLHITIKDPELVEQMNLILAAHFDGKAVGGKRHHDH